MTLVQKKRLELLVELDEICRKLGISYFLYGKTALFAVRSGQFEQEITPVIAIMADDVRVFYKYLEDNPKESRYLECPLNSPRFPRFCLRYGRSDSLYMNVGEIGRYQNWGLYVLIEILWQKEATEKEELKNFTLEMGWEAYINPVIRTQKNESAYREVKKLSHKYGEEQLGKILFEQQLKNISNQSEEYFIKRYKNSRKYFPSGLFAEKVTVKLDEYNFWIPKNKTKYLNLIQGKSWKTKEVVPELLYSPDVFVNAEIPFQDYLDFFAEEGIEIEKKYEQRYRYLLYKRKLNKISEVISASWKRLFLSGERYNLWYYYYPLKSQMREYYEHGKINELEQYLQPYIESAAQYMKDGLGLYFDDEIFNWYRYVMEKRNKSCVVDKVWKLTSDVDRKPIRIKTYDGKYVE